MKFTMSDLLKEDIWRNFYKLSQIPRPSGCMQEVADFIEDFGKNLGLETLRDKANNIIIRKPATLGYENCKTIILQSHMDMVPQKNEGTVHDFTKDPISLLIQENWLTADGTTLGADNGIGVAAILSVLEQKSLPHGNIEALFTVDEENGMNGAFALADDVLKGDILLNLDSEDEHELIVGCCGAVKVECNFPFVKESVPVGDKAFKIAVVGLQGGHSGIDIHLQRANANKLLFHFLKTLVCDFEARLAFVEGGDVVNAIPRESFAVITIPKGGEDDLFDVTQEFLEIYKTEYSTLEPTLNLTVEPTEIPDGLFPEFVQDDLINAVVAVPNGVYRYMPNLKDSVETSSNLGIIKTMETNVTLEFLVRSVLESMKGEVRSMIESAFSLAGAKINVFGNYEGWMPESCSEILSLAQEKYVSVFGRESLTKTIHAGLECGIIGSKYPCLDMISFGPTIKYPHSPNERVDIGSVERFWEFLKIVLASAPQKK